MHSQSPKCGSNPGLSSQLPTRYSNLSFDKSLGKMKVSSMLLNIKNHLSAFDKSHSTKIPTLDFFVVVLHAFLFIAITLIFPLFEFIFNYMLVTFPPPNFLRKSRIVSNFFLPFSRSSIVYISQQNLQPTRQ